MVASMIILLATAAFVSSPGVVRRPPPVDLARGSDADWFIGPVIRGRSYSPKMPARPTPTATGWSFAFPVGRTRDVGHVHYVATPVRPLTGYHEVVVRYRIDAAPAARFVPQEAPQFTATVTLVAQRAGDTWTARGAYEAYRWYWNKPVPLAPGVYELRAPLTGPGWVSIMGTTAPTGRDGLAATLADPDNIGLVFGSQGGLGHGVFATAPARFTLLSFTLR